MDKTTDPARTPAKHVGKIIGKRAPSPDPSSSPAETVHERIALDGGLADVDAEGQHVELTIRLGDRAALGLILSPAEADRIADALQGAARAAWTVQAADVSLEDVNTVTQLWHRANEAGVPASALVHRIGGRDYLAAAEDRYSRVTRDINATAADIIAAESALRDARADAEADQTA